MLPVFEQIYTLPLSESGEILSYGYGQRRADKYIFHMCGHIVAPLQRMFETLPAVRDECFEKSSAIPAYGRIVVFVDGQRGRSVSEKDMGYTVSDTLYLPLYLVAYEVYTPLPRRKYQSVGKCQFPSPSEQDELCRGDMLHPSSCGSA